MPSNVTVTGVVEGGQLIVWTLAAHESGVPQSYAAYPLRSVQIDGAFSGASVLLEGSNDLTNPTTWSPLRNAYGDLLQASSPSFHMTDDIPLWTRARVEGGEDTTRITIHLLVQHS